MSLSNTEGLSDERLREIAEWAAHERAECLLHSMPGRATHYEDIAILARNALSRRAANRTGGVDVKADEEDLASDDRWNAGVNYAIERLCKILGVDPKAISWDAATETLDGDVMSVICNVLVAAYGEEWSSNERDTAIIRNALAAEAEPVARAPGGVEVKAFADAILDNSKPGSSEVDLNFNSGLVAALKSIEPILSSLAAEAEPVAWINGEREIMLGWFRRYIDEQYSCGQVDDGMRLERLHKLLSGSPHPSSPVSVEVTVTDEMVERAARAMEPMAFREEFTATDEWYELEQEGRNQALGRARAALTAALDQHGKEG